jgi:hypothetical protein
MPRWSPLQPPVDGITIDFPHPIFKQIHGEPTRKALVKMHKNLCENVTAVMSNLGSGNYSHLALLMTDKNYLKDTKQTFTAPKNPAGDDPPTALKPEDQPAVNDRYKQSQQQIYKNLETPTRPSRSRLLKQLWKKISSAHCATNSLGSIKVRWAHTSTPPTET